MSLTQTAALNAINTALSAINALISDLALEDGGNLEDSATALAAIDTAIGATNNAAVSNPTSNASVIAALKGILDVNSDNVELLASSAITSDSQSSDVKNYRGRNLLLFIKTGSFGAGASAITVKIQGKDPVSSTYYDILTSASLSASSFVVLRVSPHLAASANLIATDVLPKTWRVTYQASDWGTGGSTLGIACAMIV